MGKKIAGAAVDGLLGHDMLPVPGKGLQGVGDGSRAGGHRQTRGAALQSGDALLKNILGGVVHPAVDVALPGQGEQLRPVLAVVKHIGGGGVDGNRPGAGGGIRLLLAHVKLLGFKTVIRHGYVPLSRIN